jgi:hypothetical protein
VDKSYFSRNNIGIVIIFAIILISFGIFQFEVNHQVSNQAMKERHTIINKQDKLLMDTHNMTQKVLDILENMSKTSY